MKPEREAQWQRLLLEVAKNGKVFLNQYCKQKEDSGFYSFVYYRCKNGRYSLILKEGWLTKNG